MAGSEKIVSLKIEVARQRCEALSDEIGSLKNKGYSSGGTLKLLLFVEKAAGVILSYLDEQKSLPDRELLTEDELEDRVHRLTELIPFLHILLGFIEGSDIASTPTPLVLQLRRFARTVVPHSDVVVCARPELNYSITEVASLIRDLVAQTTLKECCELLPEFLFVVTIPRVESMEVLLHCILSHELGHGLYERYGLAAKILPKVQINQERVRSLVNVIVTQVEPTMAKAPPLVEVGMRELITQQVTGRITKWVQELCSDAFGVQLFGPAYYFAFVYFFLAFEYLDKDSQTHPPPRLRLRLMSKIVRRLYPESCFKETVLGFIQFWSSVSEKEIRCRDEIGGIALGAIQANTILESIDTETEACLNPSLAYSPSRYKEDADSLGDLLTNV